ncbi:MAG: hypothetical protein Kow0037_22660 [Calditrichia bacterium]
MKRNPILLGILTLLFLWVSGWTQADTIRVANYNMLKFPGNEGYARVPYFRTVLRNIQPDIFVVEEIQTQEGLDLIHNQILDSGFSAIPFNDGPDTDTGLFYKTDQFQVLSTQYIPTDLRNIGHYHLKHLASGEELHIFAVHLKASSGSSNEQKRFLEAQILKNALLALPADANIIVTGDFNIYKSSEPAFEHLTSDGTLIDPLNAPGDWHNNPAFAWLHTQCPRLEQFGGGSSGGMDDRFDMILISDDLTDNILTATYTAYGNDGQHFNQSVNNGYNAAVPDSIADALYYASDHLPVFCDFVFSIPTTLLTGEEAPISRFELLPNYPNPFNPSTNIRINIEKAGYFKLQIFNTVGQQVHTLFEGYVQTGLHQFKWIPSDKVSGGVYFLMASNGRSQLVQKLILMK